MKHGNNFQNRRIFLKSVAVLAAGTVMAPALRVLPAEAGTILVRTEEQRILMGTIVGMSVMAPSRLQGEEGIGRAYEEINRLIAILSRFDSGTALSVLNEQGRLNGSPQELLDILDFSRQMYDCSGGRFDVTIAPVVNLLERTKGRPDASDLRNALALVDTGRLSRQGSSLRFGSSGMAATLDGVAKGYIADRAAEILQRVGIEHFMVDAGGDIRVQGSSTGSGSPWRIAIEDPDKQGNYPAVIGMRSGAVATSGGYEVFFDPQKKSHHLVNPETGASPAYVKSVSVQAPTVMQADGLATALSLMHPREALHLTSSLLGHACLLVTSTGARLASDNWGVVL